MKRSEVAIRQRRSKDKAQLSFTWDDPVCSFVNIPLIFDGIAPADDIYFHMPQGLGRLVNEHTETVAHRTRAVEDFWRRSGERGGRQAPYLVTTPAVRDMYESLLRDGDRHYRIQYRRRRSSVNP